MLLPKSVKIGTQIWDITEQKRKHNSDFAEGVYGFTIDKDNTIVLDADMSRSVRRVTLFHEVMHAIRFTFGGSHKPHKSTSYEDWEHYWIGLMEEPMLLVLRENPDLLNYLLTDD
jgi:Zn-dependent peptidase ImmA (M78 family)